MSFFWKKRGNGRDFNNFAPVRARICSRLGPPSSLSSLVHRWYIAGATSYYLHIILISSLYVHEVAPVFYQPRTCFCRGNVVVLHYLKINNHGKDRSFKIKRLFG